MKKPVLYYVYDPMCSWCWGYRPAWQALSDSLRQDIEIKYRVGGLAPDTEEPMPLEMQKFLQQTWRNIALKLGTEFNFDFWQQCQPRRATFPACRAVIAARQYDKELMMYEAIQHAYYLHAKNPSDDDTLIELASEIGVDREAFAKSLISDETQSLLMQEITDSRSLPISGFPSLVLQVGDVQYPIAIEYKDWQKTQKEILACL